MSTLEKTINLLEALPSDKIEAVYAFVRFIGTPIYEAGAETAPSQKKRSTSHAGNSPRVRKPNILNQKEVHVSWNIL